MAGQSSHPRPKATRKKQGKANQPKEEMPKAQVTETKEGTEYLIKEKKPAVVDGPSVAQKSKDELWEECISLQEELDRLQIQKKHFKIEIDKIHKSWGNSKRNLEESKASMREMLQLQEEAEKRHRTENKEHQQKLNQLEAAHHSEIFELKMAAIAMTSKTHKQHVQSEVELQKKMRLLQMDKEEKGTYSKIHVMVLKQKQQEELRQLNRSYQKQARDLQIQYNNKIQKIFEESSMLITQTGLNVIEDMKKHTTSVTMEFDKAWNEFNRSLEDKHNMWSKMRKLENGIYALEEKGKRMDVRMAKTIQENKCLTESLQEMERKMDENREKLEVLRHASVKRMEECQQEYDEMQKRQTKAILDVQQKSGLKALMLEKQIKAVTDIQEKEQLKLWVVLLCGQTDHTAAENIKKLFVSKDATIKGLKDDISRDLKVYDELVKKVKAFDISVDTWLPTGEIRSCVRKTSENNVPRKHMKFDDLMQELTALCIFEDTSLQKDIKELNPAGAECSQ
ncbi:dynein regulatory complex subunit 4-like [Mastacembelus armatus]|uniref:dynein regulatory complex subunit 4-like n=1 Tax=Mastacembelus armatus TaxID=205130 RepID=UPI000E459D8E|nr:dynein regulatory complex subunit 4-like [Mastacembelus armatus]